MNFFDCDFNNNFNITKILLACKVPAGTGEPIHNNRPSHGFAINIEGEKVYTFSTGKSLTVKENEIIFLPENSNYVVKSVTDGDCFAINFSIDTKTEFEPFIIKPKNPIPISECFFNCEKTFKAKKKGYILRCKSYLYEIICEIIENYESGYISDTQKKKLLPAIEYIHNHYFDKELNIGFLSELCGIKEAYFRRLFMRCYAVSPVKYINNLKLTFAKDLLFESAYSIEKVGELSGFNNNCYFHRLFKKEFGITPTEYRKNFT